MSQRKSSTGVSTKGYRDGSAMEKSNIVEEEASHGNMGYWITAFFLVAQMAGAGFLALPKGLANTGWLGLPMLIIFCVAVAFSGTRLGNCYVIIEERWPEVYKKHVRQPYMEIAYRAFGKVGRQVVLIAVILTLFGSTIVYAILTAQFLNSLVHGVSMCLLITITYAVFVPFTWLGTPKDFWQASILAVAATVVACAVIFVQMLVDKGTWYEPEEPHYRNPTFSSFSLGFGTILFSFGGASVFPTVQNDMSDRSQFWKSVCIAFLVLLTLYLPVSVTGYALFGFDVADNILIYRGSNLTLAMKVAIGFEIINLLGTFLIAFNAMCQTFEEMINVSRDFGIQRVLFRTALIGIELIVALGIPDFGLILNLVGGSTVALCSFFAPSAMYIKLVDDTSDPNWPVRTIPRWQRIFLYEIIFVAVVGGICSTGSAIYAIANSDFSTSCFADYSQ